jgi:Variant SH3 domain
MDFAKTEDHHGSGMANYRANSDYEDQDTHPLKLAVGDVVQTGKKDQTWPGWIWAMDAQGNDGYIPEDILESTGQGSSRVLEDFDPRVLKIKRGDRLESVKRIHGWHWCRNDSSEEGWVAGYLLRPDT